MTPPGQRACLDEGVNIFVGVIFMKIINNDAYKFYNFLMQGYQEGDLSKGFDSSVNNLFVHGAIGLASMRLAHLFPEGSPVAGL